MKFDHALFESLKVSQPPKRMDRLCELMRADVAASPVNRQIRDIAVSPIHDPLNQLSNNRLSILRRCFGSIPDHWYDGRKRTDFLFVFR
jgi:hypothetical protein